MYSKPSKSKPSQAKLHCIPLPAQARSTRLRKQLFSKQRRDPAVPSLHHTSPTASHMSLSPPILSPCHSLIDYHNYRIYGMYDLKSQPHCMMMPRSHSSPLLLHPPITSRVTRRLCCIISAGCAPTCCPHPPSPHHSHMPPTLLIRHTPPLNPRTARRDDHDNWDEHIFQKQSCP